MIARTNTCSEHTTHLLSRTECSTSPPDRSTPINYTCCHWVSNSAQPTRLKRKPQGKAETSACGGCQHNMCSSGSQQDLGACRSLPLVRPFRLTVTVGLDGHAGLPQEVYGIPPLRYTVHLPYSGCSYMPRSAGLVGSPCTTCHPPQPLNACSVRCRVKNFFAACDKCACCLYL